MCTVKKNPLVYLEHAKALQKNLQFTLETAKADGNLAFLDLNINVTDEKQIICHWYQKSIAIG